MSMSFIRAFLLLVTVLVICAGDDLSCTTPNNENSTCVPLGSCEVLLKGLGTLNSTIVQFVQESRCAQSKGMVCCGSTAIYTFKLEPLKSDLLPDADTCGMSRATERIVGGTITTLWEFPWMALLGYSNDDDSFAGFKCGGSLINSRYVLTAAHCVKEDTTRGFTLDRVRLGEHRISTSLDCEPDTINECSDPVVDVRIEKHIAHSRYGRRSGDNDIALIRLQRNIVYTDFIVPICLPSADSSKPQTGTKFMVSGWGIVENGSTSDVKLKVEVPTVPNDECMKLFKNKGKITQNQICAGGKQGKDSCQGDSGGPLMRSSERETVKKTKWFQEGVVASGIGCGIDGIPGIYTRVSEYLDWILDNISEF